MEKTFLQRQWLTVRRQLMPVLVMVALMWLAQLSDLVLPKAWSLDNWGIQPREVASLPGVALAPFLHDGFIHLLENTVPLLVLGWLVVVSGRWLFFRVALVTGLSSGLGAWALGQSGSLHIGASGIVFGLLGFLIARGWVARRVGWTLISVGVGVFYFGTMLGLLGPKPHISWSSHFWGFLGGLGFAWWLYRHEGRRYLSGTAKKGKELEQGSSGLVERIAGMGMDLVKGKDLKPGTKTPSSKEPQ
jgi:membrane associated rhomboid family serine protease